MLVFDIGANIGKFTDKCISVLDNTTIIVVEPNDKLNSFLSEKYKNNNNIEVLSYLVSERDDDFVDFYVSNADTISTSSKEWIENSRFSSDYVWYPPVKKKTITLDWLIKKYGVPDLIKIDVEGYEFEVIKGLTSKAKEICFEWAEETFNQTNLTSKHLQQLGYENFGFTHRDDYLIRPNEYTKWEDCELHKEIVEGSNKLWGNIWVK